ncbi:MAG: hypothetical protein ACFFG0_37405 [Candidatus Thorarchaeota archaeon]
MVKVKTNVIQKEGKSNSEIIEKLVEIYKLNDLKIERNENEFEKLKKKVGDIKYRI